MQMFLPPRLKNLLPRNPSFFDDFLSAFSCVLQRFYGFPSVSERILLREYKHEYVAVQLDGSALESTRSIADPGTFAV